MALPMKHTESKIGVFDEVMRNSVIAVAALAKTEVKEVVDKLFAVYDDFKGSAVTAYGLSEPYSQGPPVPFPVGQCVGPPKPPAQPRAPGLAARTPSWAHP